MTVYPAIAIVGCACVAPGALSPEELWRVVHDGRVVYGAAPRLRWRADVERLKANYARGAKGEGVGADHGGYVAGFEQVFSPEGFAVPSDVFAGLEPLYLWLAHCGREALSGIDLAPGSEKLSRAGAIIGNLCYPTEGLAALAESIWLQKNPPPEIDWRNRFASGYPAHFLCRALGLGAGGFALDAACASSIYAIKLAIDWLADGRADVMLAGGVNGADFLGLNVGFTALNALSPTGRSRPFHAEADGLIPAEGAALVALKRVEDACRDGDRILAVIRGIGLTNDGRSGGFLTPAQDGQEAAMAQAYAAAGVEPDVVSYVECHATGTPLGDKVEIESLKKLFGAKRALPIGSLKANLGHLTTASAAIGLIKLLRALRSRVLPPTPNARPTQATLADVGLEVLDHPRPWTSEAPRWAAINAFGFGGNNAHLLIEEWTPAVVPELRNRAPRRREAAVVAIGAHCGADANVESVRRRFLSGATGGRAVVENIELPILALRSPPEDLARGLPQQLLLARVVLEALEQTSALPTRTSVLVGMGCDPDAARHAFRARLPDLGEDADAGVGPIDAAAVVGAMANILANRLNAAFDFRGPSFAIAAEEASGVRALEVAIRALDAGEADAVVIGAVDLSAEPMHRRAAAILRDTRRSAGDAACALVLKRVEDAKREGLPILATASVGASEREESISWMPHAARHCECFGVAHAADGLLQLCGAILSVRDGVLPASKMLPAEPWIAPAAQRRAMLRIEAFGADPIEVAVAGGTAAPQGLGAEAPLVLTYGGESLAELATRLALDQPTDSRRLPNGPRVAFVTAASRDQARAAASAFIRARLAGEPPPVLPPGVAFSPGPIKGGLAFVFTGAGAAYLGMGRELLLAYPQILASASEAAGPHVAQAAWAYGDSSPTPDAFQQLIGSSLLCQAHARLSRALGLSPGAAIGVSSGETNALFALGAWDDLDGFLAELHECGLYQRLLGGSREAVRTWRAKRGVTGDQWATWLVRASEKEALAALDGEPAAHMLIIHSPEEVVLGGEPAACRRAIERIGSGRAALLEPGLAVHCPEVAACGELWRRLHHRPTRQPDGVRFYGNFHGRAYELTSESVADALLGQALGAVDFPRTILQAWEDGARIFLEHGPRGECSRWIRTILGSREHLAISYDLFNRPSLSQAWHAIASLMAAGVAIDVAALNSPAPAQGALGEAKPSIVFPGHRPQVTLRGPRKSTWDEATAEVMRRPPAEPQPLAVASIKPIMIDPRPIATPSPPNPHLSIHQLLTARHLAYLADAQAAEQRFQTLIGAAWRAMGGAGAKLHSEASVVAAPREHAIANAAEPDRVEPSFNRRQLETLASGKISEVFGPLFEGQDGFARQVRLPTPPLLLVDRVTRLSATPRSMGKGIIWTETDIVAGDWRLHHGRVPASLAVEAGQSDLLLISWLGVDFHNRGERVYRLLGCELTVLGQLPKIGDTLRYEIHIDRHARAGDVAMFFFHYDMRIDGAVRLQVRNGQAGFFTDAELAASEGVLWSPETADHKPDGEARLDPHEARCSKRRFSEADLRAFAEGDIRACFGAGYELVASHTRTPRIQGGPMLLLREVAEFDPEGGPWRRGYLRAEWTVRPDDWFFDCHFKNDPCMPGTLMLEACLQAMATFMTATGMTLHHDGWRFEPAQNRPYRLKCRGQVTPTSRLVTYEIFVEELIVGPTPTLIADVLGSVDGVKAMHCHGLTLQLTPDWPLEERKAELDGFSDPEPVANEGGHSFGYRSLLACASGRPSDAFGPYYRRYDVGRRVPRLPSPPYLFVSRIARVDGSVGERRTGIAVEAAYDIPAAAWYFDAAPEPVMPFPILLEAALQPCGWLVSHAGFFQAEEDLAFRNLGGEATAHRALRPGEGALRTKAVLETASQAGNIVILGFRVECRIDGALALEMTASFCFFPIAPLAAQNGLTATPAELEAYSAAPEAELDLAAEWLSAFGRAGILRPPLLMLDRITGWWPKGGKAGLGRIRGEKRVDPGEWFFRAHFFQDPVQPGSLGLEAMLQLLKIHMQRAGLLDGLIEPSIEPIAVGVRTNWKYRGQILPTNKMVCAILDVGEVRRSTHEVVVLAQGSVWVDGAKIYEIDQIGVRAISRPSSSPPRTSELVETLDPVATPWISDHCPTLVFPVAPLMWLADLMARCAAQSRPGVVVTGLRNVAMTRWLDLSKGPLTLRCRVTGEGDALKTIISIPDGTVVAHGEALFDQRAAPAVVPVSGLSEPVSGESLYADGLLFHGPSFQTVRELRRGSGCAVALIDAAFRGVPQGLLNPGLLDGMAQIVHDPLPDDWSGLESGCLAFPSMIESLDLFAVPPKSGAFETRVRPLEPSAARPSLRRFAHQLVCDGRVLIEIRILYAAYKKGPVSAYSAQDRRRFVKGRRPVPGLGLGRFEGGRTILAPADLAAADWLPGTVAAVFDCPGLRGLDLLRTVAVKQHVAQSVNLHPSEVAIEGNRSPACPRLPFNQFRIDALATSAGVAVSDVRPTSIDIDAVRSFWRARGAQTDSAMFDLLMEIIRRFVRKWEVAAAAQVKAMQGRAALFLANHQTYMEGWPLCMLASACFGAPTRAIIKAEHVKGWVGAVERFALSEPGAHYGNPPYFFDQSIPESIFSILDEFARLQEKGPQSLLVFVEGERMTSAKDRLGKVSAILLDFAIRRGLPIVPVAVAAGLPEEPVDEKLDFPLNWGRQDYLIGAPIEPHELARHKLPERRRLIIDAINALLDEGAARLAPGEADFVERIRKRAASPQTGPFHAVRAALIETLLTMERPGERAVRTLEALQSKSASHIDQWSSAFAYWLQTGMET